MPLRSMLDGIVLVLSLASLSGAQTTPIAIVHARIIDGSGAHSTTDGIVLLRGKRIEAVGAASAVRVPVDARILDAAGKTVMPGLADMHVHLTGGWNGENTDMLGYQRYLNALLYAGVTTVLDTGNIQPYILQIRQEVASGRILGPRIYCAGALIDGPDPIWPEIALTVSSIAQIPALVQRQKRIGVDALKAYAGLSVPEVTRLAAEGAKAGLRVFVDQGRRNGSIDLVNSGIAAFAHLPGSVMDENALDLARDKQIAFITTLASFEALAESRLRNLDFLSEPLIADTTPPWFLDQLRQFAGRPGTAEAAARRKLWMQQVQAAETNAQKLWSKGVLVVAGTDAPYPGDFQGEGVHRDLELLVEAGLTPLQAIQSATRNAARLMNAVDDWGTLEPGKLANVLVIDGRPDQNIRDTHNVEIVIKEGVVLDRQQLKFNAARDPGFLTSSSLSSVP